MRTSKETGFDWINGIWMTESHDDGSWDESDWSSESIGSLDDWSGVTGPGTMSLELLA